MGLRYDVRMTTALHRLDEILHALRQGMTDVYGRRLLSLYLFGSYARGEADDESDIDILVVLDRVPSYGAEIDRTGALVSELSLRYGVSISRVFVSRADWLGGSTPFLAAVRAEAVAA